MAPSLLQPHISILSRTDDPAAQAASQKTLTPTLAIGIAIAVLLFVSICLWLGIHHLRKKSSAKREEGRGAAFFERSRYPEGSGTLGIKGDTFSREQLSVNIVMPEKAILRVNASRDEIIEHYTAEGTLPRPFAPFMTGGGTLSVPTAEDKNANRQSTASWISIPGRHSFIGGSSNRSSVASFASTAEGDKRKIRQVFAPVLPDELVISLGENLTVVNSFDDGWCIVGRDSVFKPGEVELGAIPAWCFMKAVQGLRAERPMRTTSLGVTITLDAPAGPRDNVMSWSNF
ncbi:hypothetical protein EW026_g3202 [Hermanssonia centrifuga]|uniref:SH3 domain-containing protein n=1 Tax=Hermanssonia centrifuga TaxID=98765 RepID=A0A4S4KLW9_9APHY|nr:hypothetical protein EW026_g3202 [Hermanssonia centrifuga]